MLIYFDIMCYILLYVGIYVDMFWYILICFDLLWYILVYVDMYIYIYIYYFFEKVTCSRKRLPVLDQQYKIGVNKRAENDELVENLNLGKLVWGIIL